MGEWPNKSTQFKPGNPGRPAGAPMMSARRARKLRTAAAMAEASGLVLPEYTGEDSREFLIGVMQGRYRADPARMTAATMLLKVQHPTLQAVAVKDVSAPRDRADRDARILELLEKGLAGGIALIEG